MKQKSRTGIGSWQVKPEQIDRRLPRRILAQRYTNTPRQSSRHSTQEREYCRLSFLENKVRNRIILHLYSSMKIKTELISETCWAP